MKNTLMIFVCNYKSKTNLLIEKLILLQIKSEENIRKENKLIEIN